MKLNKCLKLGLWLVALLPLTAMAQSTDNNYNNNNDDHQWTSDNRYGPRQGNLEFTLSGAGTSNKQMDNSLGGANVSIGEYFTNSTELLLRQEVDYSHPPGSQAWNGSTKAALDQLLVFHGPIRPYLGVNIGGIYGDSVEDTGAAGLEGGLKVYALPKTFLFAGAEYDWFFRNAHGIVGSTKFNEGEWNWSIGVGFDL